MKSGRKEGEKKFGMTVFLLSWKFLRLLKEVVWERKSVSQPQNRRSHHKAVFPFIVVIIDRQIVVVLVFIIVRWGGKVFNHFSNC